MAINNLSREAEEWVKTEGQQQLTLYAYDNLDIDLKHVTPTLENAQDTLTHLTSVTILPLCHGVTLEDLDCAETVWKNLSNNIDNGQVRLNITLRQLLSIHPDDKSHLSGLTACWQCFNAWKFICDLVDHGPKYFHQFRGRTEELKLLKEVYSISVMKTTQIPMCMRDIKPSSPAENNQALQNMYHQAGLTEDSVEKDLAPDLGNEAAALPRVLLIFGDLLTGQHIQSLMESRSEEKTPF